MPKNKKEVLRMLLTLLAEFAVVVTLMLGMAWLLGCTPQCQVKQSRCNGPLVEVCSGGRWHRFADCSRILKLEDGRVVDGSCQVRSNGRSGCERRTP